MKSISNQIGTNQLTSSTTWAWKKMYWEVFMAMVLTNHHPFNRKVFSQSSKDMTQSLRRSLVLVRLVLSLFLHCKLLIPLVHTLRRLSLLQQESFPCKVHLWCTPSESTTKSKFMHASEEPVSEKTSKFWRAEFMLLSEPQEEFTIWWKKGSSEPNIWDSLSWTKPMRCSLVDSKLRFKKYLSSCQETSKLLSSLPPCQTKSSRWPNTSWETQRRSWWRVKT